MCPANERYICIWRSLSIVADMFNAFILLIAVGVNSHEIVVCFRKPGPVANTTVILEYTMRLRLYDCLR
jgi:hypothetical protein